MYRDGGFTFDGGPTVITAPGCIEELFEAAGRKLSEIAEAMHLSPKTVSVYRARLLQKMGMRTNADITLYVVTNGLLG